jgi:Fe-S cluster biogenesis protein NfuA
VSDDVLPGEARRIEQLLDDVQSLAAGPVWARVEELVQRLVHLYGAGLARLITHVPPAAADQVASDELVASLLLLHGLHPWPLERRVREALEQARPQLSAHVGTFTLVSVEGDLARLRLEGAPPSAALSAERLLHRALIDAAPEIARVEVEGVTRAEPAERLVQIDLRRSEAR